MLNNRERFRSLNVNSVERVQGTNQDARYIRLNQQLNKTVNSALIDRLRQNTLSRRYFVLWSSFLVSCWMWKVGEILVNNNEKYCLSDNVLITLLGTTTLNVLGIVAIAMYDLFNGKSEEKITSDQ
ncbi:hypothetical protein BWG23_00920 [Flavobacterium oreochromis]|nr:hypothetical protein BWG23_00920 [Flavobacterium oreochromis]